MAVTSTKKLAGSSVCFESLKNNWMNYHHLEPLKNNGKNHHLIITTTSSSRSSSSSRIDELNKNKGQATTKWTHWDFLLLCPFHLGSYQKVLMAFRLGLSTLIMAIKTVSHRLTHRPIWSKHSVISNCNHSVISNCNQCSQPGNKYYCTSFGIR